MQKNRLIKRISLLLSVTMLLTSVPADIFAQEIVDARENISSVGNDIEAMSNEPIYDAYSVAFKKETEESEYEDLAEAISIEEESELAEISENEVNEEIVEETAVDIVKETDYTYYKDRDVEAYFYKDTGLLKIKPVNEGSTTILPIHETTSGYPWYAIRNKITEVELGDGILSIPDYAFAEYTKLKYFKVGKDVRTIGNLVFNYDDLLETIEFLTQKDASIRIYPRAFQRKTEKVVKVINTNNNDTIREYDWYANKCTTSSKVILNAQGGSCADSITVLYGSKYFLPTPTLAGYRFLGWQDGDGNDYPEDKVVDFISKDAIELYAKWEKHIHNFDYRRVVQNGGDTWNVECQCVNFDGCCEYNNVIWTGSITPMFNDDNTAIKGWLLSDFFNYTRRSHSTVHYVDAATDGEKYDSTYGAKYAGDYYIKCNLASGNENAWIRQKFTLLPSDIIKNGNVVINYTYKDRDGNTQTLAKDDDRCKSIKLEIINPIDGSIAKTEAFDCIYSMGRPYTINYSYRLKESQDCQLIDYQIKITPYKAYKDSQTDENILNNWKVSIDGENNARIDYIPNTGVFDLNWKIKFENLPELENGVKPDKAYVKVICLSHSHNDTYWPIVQHTDSSVECSIEADGTALGTYPVWQERTVSDEPYYFGVQLVGYTFEGNYYDVTSQNYRVDEQSQSDNIVYFDRGLLTAKYKDGHGGDDAVVNLSVSDLAVPMITLDPGAGSITNKKYLADSFGGTVDISNENPIPDDTENMVFSHWTYENDYIVLDPSAVVVDRAMKLSAAYKSKVTISMNNMSMSYGDGLPVNFARARQNDNGRDITSQLHYEYSTDNGNTYKDGLPVNVGRYLIRATVYENLRHVEASDTAYLVIMPRRVYIVVKDSYKYINRPDPIFEYEVENIVPGDELDGIVLERDEGEGLGEYWIYIEEIGTSNKNYIITGYEWGIFTIKYINMYLPDKSKGDLKRAKVSGVTNLRYTGRPVFHNKETIKVSLDGKELVEGKDYSLVYSRNLDAGTAYIIVSGNGIYKKFTQVKRFKIEPALMEACHVEAEDVYTYSAGGPNVRITFNGAVLRNGIDYKIKTKYDKKTATDKDIECKYTIIGIGNFKGKIKEEYTAKVKYADVEDWSVYLPNIPQGKKNVKPFVFDSEGFLLKANRDYTISYNKDETNNLGADVVYTITGKGFFKGELKEATKVVPKDQDLGKAKLAIRDKYYDGGEYIIDSIDDFSLAVLNDTKLDKAYMFVVTPQYTSNIYPGKYKAYVIGKGILGGMKKVKYVVR